MQSRPVVPIVAGNSKFLGLSTPEWAVSGTILCPYLILGGSLFWYFFVAHVALQVFYVVYLSRLEENILMVLINNRRIPSIIRGSFVKPLPIEKSTIGDLEQRR
jgi:hypothetical protein